MELISKVPQLREISYSYSPHSDTVAGVGDDELTWIEGEQELAFCTGVKWVSLTPLPGDPGLIVGTLILSNFRIRFLPEEAKLRSLRPVNKLLSRFDVVLYNIESTYRVKRKKRKQLLHDCLLKEKVERLEINCKTFQSVLFDLSYTKEDDNLRLVYHLVQAIVTAQTDSLMVYAKHPDEEHVEETNLESYWSKELEKCGEKAYRAVTCNESFHVTDSLPKTFVVPCSLSPRDVVAMSTNFVNNRFPCWTYTCRPSRTALVKMPYKTPGIQGNVEEKIFDSIRRSHPFKEYPRVFDLSLEMPTMAEVQSSYGILQQLCIYDPARPYPSDGRWYSQLESCRWMDFVSRFLKVSREISTVLSRKGLSVVLREYSCADQSPLVASLVQIMLEEDCRTTVGFRDLVRKEWLAQGHRFGARLQSRSFGIASDSCPFFLLFLDCVHQLICLKPESFEFNSCYLILVWHTTCQGLFRDLLFNGPKDHFYTTMKVQLEFQNSSSQHRHHQQLLRRRQLGRSGRKGGDSGGVVGTLLRKSHADFTSTLKRHMTSLTNISQSQSMFSPPSSPSSPPQSQSPWWCNGHYDSYSLKKSRSRLSRFSTLSINRKSQNDDDNDCDNEGASTPTRANNDSTLSSNTSISHLHLAPRTCDYDNNSGGDWSATGRSAGLRKGASLSHQRLNSSQLLADQCDASYDNPWTDVIGEIGRGGSARLWDWSFLYEPERLLLYKSYEYVARSNAQATTTKKKKHGVEHSGVAAGRGKGGGGGRAAAVENGNGIGSTASGRRHQKSALVIKGQTIYSYTSVVASDLNPLPPSDFLAVDYSVPALTFWSSCHLKFHPSPSSFAPLRPVCSPSSSSPLHSPISMPDSGFVDVDDSPQFVFHHLSAEIMELEKCLSSLKVDSF